MKALNKLKPIAFEWDEHNQDKNWNKHKVDYREIQEIFHNRDLKLLRDVKHSQTEKRYVALGVTNKAKKLYVIFTVRKGKIRVISARNQSKKERNFYEKQAS